MTYLFHKKDLNFFYSFLRFFYRIIVYFFKPKKKYIKQIKKLGLKYLVFIDEHVGFRMLFPGLHESDEIKILDNLSKIIIQKKRENIHFIDVGANFGLFTLYFSKLLNSKGYVHAIEPDNECSKLIKESAQINNLKNILINSCAISDKVGFTKMIREDDESSFQSSLSFVGKINTKADDLNKVEVTTLDSICEKINNEIDIVKIDVEGHEASVINGFKLSLSNPDKSPKVMMIELVDRQLKRFGASREELINLIVSFGYESYIIKNNKLTNNLSSYKNIHNIFFIKKDFLLEIENSEKEKIFK